VCRRRFPCRSRNTVTQGAGAGGWNRSTGMSIATAMPGRDGRAPAVRKT